MRGASTRAAQRRKPRSGGGRIPPHQLGAPQQTFDEVGAAHGGKSAGAILLADQEQDALLVDEAAIDFRNRQLWIPGVDRRRLGSTAVGCGSLSPLRRP